MKRKKVYRSDLALLLTMRRTLQVSVVVEDEFGRRSRGFPFG